MDPLLVGPVKYGRGEIARASFAGVFGPGVMWLLVGAFLALVWWLEPHVVEALPAQFLLTLALLVVAFGLVLPTLEYRAIARHVRAADPTTLFRFGNDALEIETGHVHVRVRWPAVFRVIETKAAFSLLAFPRTGFLLPKRALAEGETVALRALLREHLGARANLRKG